MQIKLRIKRGKLTLLFWSALVAIIFAFTIPASEIRMVHPGSGIVVDRSGQIFISDLKRGLLKIDQKGKITTISKEGGHWLALDEAGNFSQVDFSASSHWPRWFKRRTPTGVRPALITDGGSPLVTGTDGNIYFVCNDEKLVPGGLQIGQVSPRGNERLLNPQLRDVSEKLGGIKGLALGPDGLLYASYPKAILKVKMDGTFSTVMNAVPVPHCESNVPEKDAPLLAGLAVDSSGTIYVAASGCGALVKITNERNCSTVLQSERPWAPSGVALYHGDVYVLEHISPNSVEHEDWLPRIRKLGRDGKISTIVTMPK